MAIRTVRLDDESEQAVAEIRRATGWSVSVVLKRGVIAVREQLRSEPGARPFEIYRRIELGPGGDARAPARNAKSGVRAILRQRRAR